MTYGGFRRVLTKGFQIHIIKIPTSWTSVLTGVNVASELTYQFTAATGIINSQQRFHSPASHPCCSHELFVYEWESFSRTQI